LLDTPNQSADDSLTEATGTGVPPEDCPPKDVTTALSACVLVGLEENETTSDVVVADCTVPAAPRLNDTRLAPGVAALKPVPRIIIDAESAPRLDVTCVTVGAATIVATCTAAPLEPPNDVTTAVRDPRFGACVNVRVSDVDVAEATVNAPLLRTTWLPAAVESKPVPAMTSVAGELTALLTRLCETVGAAITVATCTAAPLEPPNDVTTAVRDPRFGACVNVRVSDVDVAEATVNAPLLRTTWLPAAVESKPVPAMTSVVGELTALLAELRETVGAGTTLATCTGDPLDRPKDVTTAVSAPRLGACESDTVSCVAVAAVTEPAPLLRMTILPAAVGSKLNPLMTSVVEPTARPAELGVTIGRGGTKTSPMDEIRGNPVIGSSGSTASGAAVTVNLLF
jgi:hypothetical protein